MSWYQACFSQGMKRGCPNSNCHYHQKSDYIVNDGRYFRKGDSKWISRFKCRYCGKRFSAATFSSLFGQKKRRVNSPLKKLLSSGVSMRRAAKILKIHQLTVKRKLIFLAKQAASSQKMFLEKLRADPVAHIQFDDLITIEHTKMKPLTISIAVDVGSRAILGAEVAQIPAFGHLAETSRRKYGHRKSFHKKALERLFLQIQSSIIQTPLLESDEHSVYPSYVQKYFPRGIHTRYKGGRGCIVGQGELKKLHRDPLFYINQTCAMFRANINRLIRKTWCTTKLPEMLKNHIDIFIDYYNKEIIPKTI